MDTVVLAAGRGERLSEVTAPGHKPLIIVNGRPIVQQAVDYGRQLGGRVIVVVSPENASPISHVLGMRAVRMVVQRRADGPGPALGLGLELARSDKVLVLMGDNISTYADVKKVVDANWGVGVQLVDEIESERFTIYDHTAGAWREKVKPAMTSMSDPSTGMFTAWVGPVVVSRKAGLDLYMTGEDIPDIGPHLSTLAENKSRECVPVSTYDIGVPEMLA